MFRRIVFVFSAFVLFSACGGRGGSNGVSDNSKVKDEALQELDLDSVQNTTLCSLSIEVSPNLNLSVDDRVVVEGEDFESFSCTGNYASLSNNGPTGAIRGVIFSYFPVDGSNNGSTLNFSFSENQRVTEFEEGQIISGSLYISQQSEAVEQSDGSISVTNDIYSSEFNGCELEVVGVKSGRRAFGPDNTQTVNRDVLGLIKCDDLLTKLSDPDAEQVELIDLRFVVALYNI